MEVFRTRRRTKGSVVSDSSPEPEEVESTKPEVIDVDVTLDEEAMETGDELREPSMEIEFRQNNFQSSTKLDALMRDLRECKGIRLLEC